MNLRSAKNSSTQLSKPQKTNSPALLDPDVQAEPKELPVKRLKKSNKKIEIIQKTEQQRIPSIGPSDFKPWLTKLNLSSSLLRTLRTSLQHCFQEDLEKAQI